MKDRRVFILPLSHSTHSVEADSKGRDDKERKCKLFDCVVGYDEEILFGGYIGLTVLHRAQYIKQG